MGLGHASPKRTVCMQHSFKGIVLQGDRSNFLLFTEVSKVRRKHDDLIEGTYFSLCRWKKRGLIHWFKTYTSQNLVADSEFPSLESESVSRSVQLAEHLFMNLKRDCLWQIFLVLKNTICIRIRPGSSTLANAAWFVPDYFYKYPLHLQDSNFVTLAVYWSHFQFYS